VSEEALNETKTTNKNNNENVNARREGKKDLNKFIF